MSDHNGINSPILYELSTAVQERVGDWYDFREKPEIRLLDVQKRSVSFFVSFAACSVAGESKKFIVKIPRTRETETIQEVRLCEELLRVGREEYNCLRKVAAIIEQCDDPLMLSIRPLGYLPAWNAIVMEELPAISIEQLLLSMGSRVGVPRTRTRLEESLQRAGKWLRFYHEQLGNWRVIPISLTGMKKKYQQRFQTLQTIYGKQKWLSDLAFKFEKAIQALDGRPVPFVLNHGDYYCKNILVTPFGGVTAVDFDVRSQVDAPVYLDIATLITDIAIQKVKVRSLGFLMPPSYLIGLGERVLEGYFDDQTCDMEVLHLYNAAGAISALHWYQMRPMNNVVAIDRVIAKLLKPYLTNYLVWLAHRQLEKALSPMV